MTSLIKCRKCGGPHVTLRCGKEKTEPQIITIEPKNEIKKPFIKQFNKPYIDKRKIVTVRISNLPDDITIDELTELMSEWGMISRINMSNYECKSGFIDFYNIDEAEYFVKAVDKTPFDRLILRVEILDKNS